MNTFKTQIDTKTNRYNISPFYWTILKSWNILRSIKNEDVDVFDIRRQWLWMNKHIKINGQEIKWKMWINKGINTIHNIVNNKGEFYTAVELEQKYNINCNFLRYNSLKDAIPWVWRDKLKTENVQQNDITTQDDLSLVINKHRVPIQKITNKKIYWELIEMIRITPIIKDKWIQEFNIPEDDWENIFKVGKVIRDTKIRTFQYKLIFKLIPCNLYLFKIGRSNSDTCHFCNYIDNIGHYFYECHETKSFWLAVQNWWNNMGDEKIIINKEMAILGTLKGIVENEKLSAV
jgi:hypothetical protein